jgi:ketosteroid isomerase-like protein
MTGDDVFRAAVAQEMQLINAAWLNGQVDDMEGSIHPDIVMAIPGLAARVQGRDALLAGFRDFCNNAKVHEFHDREMQIDVAGRTAVVTIQYEMLYERSGARYRATGRDLWVFERHGDSCIAVWRTMLDMQENAA